jgi:hypothetical protein
MSDEFSQESSYEEPVFQHSTETKSPVRRVRERGRLTKAHKAAQMRRWRTKASVRTEYRRKARERMRKLRNADKSSPPEPSWHEPYTVEVSPPYGYLQ